MVLSCGTLIFAAGMLAAGVQGREALPDSGGVPGTHVDRFLESADAPLVSYRALRHLEAATRDGRTKASLTAMTTLDPERGFQYEILEESGSNTIRTKVFRAALETERRACAAGAGARTALSRRNYDFGPVETTERGLVRVGIRPRRTDAMLIDGSILLTDDDAELVSVQGRLVKRPSFWTRRVEVVRRYTRLAGVRVPISLESTADVLFAGRSTFSMRYEYEAINDARAPR